MLTYIIYPFVSLYISNFSTCIRHCVVWKMLWQTIRSQHLCRVSMWVLFSFLYHSSAFPPYIVVLNGCGLLFYVIIISSNIQCIQCHKRGSNEYERENIWVCCMYMGGTSFIEIARAWWNWGNMVEIHVWNSGYFCTLFYVYQ